MSRNPWYTPKAQERPRTGARRRAPVHRARTDVRENVLEPVRIETCRCGAWRARVLRAGRELYTDWSGPCSVPSPAQPEEDAG